MSIGSSLEIGGRRLVPEPNEVDSNGHLLRRGRGAGPLQDGPSLCHPPVVAARKLSKISSGAAGGPVREVPKTPSWWQARTGQK
jgi:hypothetical protein